MEGVLAGVKRVDTTVSGPMAHKYATLPRVVANLQPADVGRIFACSDDPMAFLPQWGLHVTEFCLGYCNNLPHKRTDGAPALLLPIPNAAALAHGSMYGSTPPASNTTASTSASASTSADKDKDKDTTGKRKRATNPVTNPVADPPPRMTKRKKLDTLVAPTHPRAFYGHWVARLPAHCAAVPDPSRDIVLRGMHHAHPPLCTHPTMRVGCTHCGAVAAAGDIYYESTLPQPYVVWCTRCLPPRSLRD